MDFGDILDAWDQQTGKAVGKKGLKKARQGAPGDPGTADAPGPDQHSEQRVDPLTAWLRVNGISDKDAEEAENARPRGERRRRLLAKKPDATIDLHGLTRDETWIALDGFFRAAQQQGFEKLLIIHGKGNHTDGDAVLKRTVRDFIERCSYAGESGYSPAVEGGTGSTWVILKDEG
jgi:DNA-nicking Smr family endonuclease